METTIIEKNTNHAQQTTSDDINNMLIACCPDQIEHARQIIANYKKSKGSENLDTKSENILIRFIAEKLLGVDIFQAERIFRYCIKFSRSV